MSVHHWHLFGVAVPYVLIATALWFLAAGAIKDAVRVGSLPGRTSLGRGGPAVPTVPLAYLLGFAGVAFIYGCALDRNHMGLAIGMDPHEVAPGADAYLYGLSAVSWLSAALLIAPYRWLRRGTRALLAAPGERDRLQTRYQTLAEHLTDVVSHHTPTGRYEWLSPSVESVLGYSPVDLVGQDWYDFVHPDDADRVRAEALDQVLNGQGGTAISRYRIRHREGHYVWLESLTEALRDDRGAVLGLQVSSRDVTERRAAEEALQQRAYHDPLTGLANRVLFTLRLDALVEDCRAGRGGGPPSFGVLYIDLDRFKAINDTMGHAAGDALLVEFAERLRRSTRGGDTVARIGGDEFAVILHDVPNEDVALDATRRIEQELSVPFDLDGTPRTVTASIGIALGQPDYTSSGDILRDADLAAYAVKAAGRAGSALFTRALRDESDRRRRIEADLERAVERDELRVAYQPIVRLSDGALHGVEALVRWDHPALGLLAPGAFIDIAEETGRIGELDRWVMAEGLAQLARWDAAAPNALQLSVNCSARDLHEPSFRESVRAALAAVPDRARRLTIEVTESLLLDDPNRAAEVLSSLSAEGVQFALDDFGTGYSSLSVVHALPVDVVKIDRAFVQRMHEDAAAYGMVQTVIEFARVMGTHVVAEGIETPEQLEALVALGCDYGQGYLFSRPTPPDAMTAVLRSGGAWAHHWASAPMAA